MARDYKHRAQDRTYGHSRRRPKKSSGAIWRWLLIIVLIITFGVFLNMISKMLPELLGHKNSAENVTASTESGKQTPSVPSDQPSVSENKQVAPETKAAEPEEPRYDFYTILPQAEVVVPDYEIKTRVREQLVGKTKASKYVMQAGSFRDAADAEQHKAKLALLGIEARIEKAKVGNVIWHRVKIGPYDNPASVSTIKELLQKNGIGVVVTENNQ